MNIKQLLLEYYLAWQKEIGDSKSWKDFAELIGIDHVYLNKIYNGKRKAGEKITQQLANYFKDPRFYDAVGIDRPEPLTQFIVHTLPKAPENIQRKIAEELAPYTTEPIPNGETSESDQTKT